MSASMFAPTTTSTTTTTTNNNNDGSSNNDNISSNNGNNSKDTTNHLQRLPSTFWGPSAGAARVTRRRGADPGERLSVVCSEGLPLVQWILTGIVSGSFQSMFTFVTSNVESFAQ